MSDNQKNYPNCTGFVHSESQSLAHRMTRAACAAVQAVLDRQQICGFVSSAGIELRRPRATGRLKITLAQETIDQQQPLTAIAIVYARPGDDPHVVFEPQEDGELTLTTLFVDEIAKAWSDLLHQQDSLVNVTITEYGVAKRAATMQINASGETIAKGREQPLDALTLTYKS